MYIQRIVYDEIIKNLFKNKVIIIYGARQVGKTTLIKKIKEFADSKYKTAYFNCDEPDIRQAFTDKTSTELKNFIGDNNLVIIDEAQRVKNIGLTLKLLNDNYKDVQIIATVSSSFELSNKIAEPLTGRKIEFKLYTFSLQELSKNLSNIEIQRSLNDFLIYGMYPDIIVNKNDRKNSLLSLATSYSYKDILQFEGIRISAVLEKLLQLLALQVGSEVSYSELATSLGIDKNTVTKYIDILEKAFIVFSLTSFSRNLRNELKKSKKVYFWDLGIRNALINNFIPLELRTDKEKGSLFENFIIVEKIKYNANNLIYPNYYFWRTQSNKEIDFLQEIDGKIDAFEIKYSKDKISEPKIFKESYQNSTFTLINKSNFLNFCKE